MSLLGARYGSREWQQLTIFNGCLKRSTRQKYLEEFNEWKKDMQLYQRKKQREKTLKKHVELDNLEFYVTFTFNPEWKTADDDNYKTLISSIKKILSRHKIRYFLVPERHASGLWHFHGFISDNPYMQMTDKRDKYNNVVWHFLPMQENYGFTSCVLVPSNEKTKRKMIKYCVSYSIKNGSKRSLFSRIVSQKETKDAKND